MAWTAPRTWVTGEIITAAQLNTHLKENLIDLDRRTTVTGAITANIENTTSTTYTDLSTVGPTVLVPIGAAGKALVAIYGALSNGGGNFALMSYATEGATIGAAQDDTSLQTNSVADVRMGATVLFTGNEGSTTFKAKYRVTGTTGTFNGRRILVTPLGS